MGESGRVSGNQRGTWNYLSWVPSSLVSLALFACCQGLSEALEL
jgi:hypothetical protein